MKELNSKDIEAVTAGAVPVAIYYAYVVGKAYAGYIGGAAALGFGAAYGAGFIQGYLDGR